MRWSNFYSKPCVCLWAEQYSFNAVALNYCQNVSRCCYLLFEFTQGCLSLGYSERKWIEVKAGMAAFKTANPCVFLRAYLSRASPYALM